MNMATSKLQIAVGDMLDNTFPQYHIHENCRPDWMLSSNLTKLELDFYIEEIKVAFEIQGAQHYQFVEFFHGTYEKFEQRKQYDQEKRDLCYGAGIKLFEIDTLMDAIIRIGEIKDHNKKIQLGEKNIAERARTCKLPLENSGGMPKNKASHQNQISLQNKGEVISSEQRTNISLNKYIKSRNKYHNNDNATDKEKRDEIRKFYKKLHKYNLKDDSGKLIPFFGFKYLGIIEQDALLEEAGILQKISHESSIRAINIGWLSTSS
jgi:hypothetical protein